MIKINISRETNTKSILINRQVKFNYLKRERNGVTKLAIAANVDVSTS